MKTPNASVFELRMSVLRYIANHRPRRISCSELLKHHAVHERTLQRVLKEMTKLGYLDCDYCSPSGYRIVLSKFEDFK